MSRPKVDARMQEAVKRLRNNSDFRAYVQFQQAQLEWLKSALINAPPTDVQVLQGRAAQLSDDITTLTKE